MTAIDRAAFDLDVKHVYVNHAAIGALPIAARNAIVNYAGAHAKHGVLGVAGYEMRLDENRARLARFLGAGASEVAFLRNTSEAVNILARGLNLQTGDEIITNDNEFGANALPWLALRENGITVKFIKTQHERMTPDVLARHMTANTKVVTLSWVSFIDGYRHDLAALADIAHKHDAIFAVDVIQGLGAFPFSMRDLNIDAAYGGGQKWLLAEPGLGYLAVRESLIEKMSVHLPGWRSLTDMWNFLDYEQPYCSGAARFEAGTPNLIGIAALMATLDLLDSSGLDRIGNHVLGLVQHLREGLSRLGAEIASLMGATCESGILTYRFANIDPLLTGQALAEVGVITTNRSNGVRISPHGYNTIDEMNVIIDTMTQHLKRAK
jgi:cysteine desulfurase/selenocysteine lyase